jgi:hypothetical protein
MTILFDDEILRVQSSNGTILAIECDNVQFD